MNSKTKDKRRQDTKNRQAENKNMQNVKPYDGLIIQLYYVNL